MSDDPQRTFVVEASVQCSGTIDIGAAAVPGTLPGLYEILAAVLGPHLAGWENGDTIWLAASSRQVRVQP